eukprot:CAMPEP_0118706354 /NCGR_PEP_ID=MMETSP0800-20121206/20508_1 /TAXON_ID=210618 ORGANISM="Striatella unipunctata, Strain CCMP2910" /NCGR_SAMPLE_ID=MMETSP0800 /ASSEMBLY_ACC=CAM_ASM_000638 /LENGTH=211 /DNA_ID=CAMNT_0006608873 /DNA_START=93 /DNA_END=728 /DNA_ORIENTATION=+
MLSTLQCRAFLLCLVSISISSTWSFVTPQAMMMMKTTKTKHNKESMVQLNAENTDRRGFMGQAAFGTSLLLSLGGLLPLTNPPPAFGDDNEVDDFVTTESGLKYKVIKAPKEDAALAKPGQEVVAQYTGWLDGFDSEKKFDSSRDRNRPFRFKVGVGQVIRGWDESFSTMGVGERRLIIVPARLGYGDRGAGGIIPGGATLYFDVEMLAIQ